MIADLVASGWSTDELYDMSLKQIYYWWEMTLLRKSRDEAIRMSGDTLSIASALGDKKAAKIKNDIVKKAIRRT